MTTIYDSWTCQCGRTTLSDFSGFVAVGCPHCGDVHVVVDASGFAASKADAEPDN